MSLQLRLGRQFGPLSRPQLRILSELRETERTVSELAERAQVSPPGATQMIDKLQHAGYVSRSSDATDQRVVRVGVTPVGRKALCDAEAVYVARLSEIIAGRLDAEEIESLAHLLEKLTRI